MRKKCIVAVVIGVLLAGAILFWPQGNDIKFSGSVDEVTGITGKVSLDIKHRQFYEFNPSLDDAKEIYLALKNAPRAALCKCIGRGDIKITYAGGKHDWVSVRYHRYEVGGESAEVSDAIEDIFLKYIEVSKPIDHSIMR